MATTPHARVVEATDELSGERVAVKVFASRSRGAGRDALQLPMTERVASSVMLLPTGTSIGGEEIDAICALLARAVANAPAVRAGLASRR